MKRKTPSSVFVHKVEYLWHVLREPQYCHEDGMKGLLISVSLKENHQRELHLDFPFSIQSRRSMPHHQRPKISERQLIELICMAKEAGWSPSKRGKPFTFVVPKPANLVVKSAS